MVRQDGADRVGRDGERVVLVVWRVSGLVTALRSNSAIVGYCYTQLTDVQQEINGLMTYGRKPKADPAELAKIFGQ